MILNHVLNLTFSLQVDMDYVATMPRLQSSAEFLVLDSPQFQALDALKLPNHLFQIGIMVQIESLLANLPTPVRVQTVLHRATRCLQPF